MQKELNNGGVRVLMALLIALTFSFSFFSLAHAHEAYVLPEQQLHHDYETAGPTAFIALHNPTNLKISLFALLGATIVLSLYYFFSTTKPGKALDRWLKKTQQWDKLILRIALAIAVFGSAITTTFLGPELSIASLPFSQYLNPLLYILGCLFFFGLFTELAAALLLILYVAAFVTHGAYLITYIEYFGLGLLLLFFGAGKISLDHRLFKKHRHNDHADVEVFLVRATYAFSILYAAVGTKLLHPQVIVDIATKYNLMKYSWLFPPDPVFIALGAGLTQVGLALSFLAGAAVRLSALATLFLVTLSIFFFRESVWPHIPLLGIGLYLFLNRGGEIGFDSTLLYPAKNHRQTKDS